MFTHIQKRLVKIYFANFFFVQPLFRNGPEILDSSLATLFGQTEYVISIKNEPDTENGGIPTDAYYTECDPLRCEPAIPEISLIKDDTDSEVDIDNDNYYIPDSITPNVSKILEKSLTKNETDSEAELEIDDEPKTTSMPQSGRLGKDFAAKNENTVNDKVDVQFTVKCQSRGLCKDLFESWDAMWYHVATYHARLQKYNTFECHLCKQRLGEKQTHQRHMNLYHFGRSLFKCSFGTCTKSFPRPDYLEKHINAEHTKQNRIKCTNCPKKFNFKYNLVRHLAYTHGIGISYSCHLCKKKLGEKRSLQYHMISQHTGLYPYKCPMCMTGFAAERYLKRHLNRKASTCNELHV